MGSARSALGSDASTSTTDKARDAASEDGKTTDAADAGDTGAETCRLTLVASITPHPTRRVDGTASLTHPFRFVIPSSIPVTAGQPHEGEATFEFRLGSGHLVPDATVTMYGFELEPSGTTFSAPVTVRIANTKNVPTTFSIPTGFFDASVGRWEHLGQATWDGTRFAFTTTHFTPIDANAKRGSDPGVAGASGPPPSPPPVGPCGGGCCPPPPPGGPPPPPDPGSGPPPFEGIGSRAAMTGEALSQTFRLPTYRVRNEAFGITLGYDSGLAGGRSQGAAPNDYQAVGHSRHAVSVRGLRLSAVTVPAATAARGDRGFPVPRRPGLCGAQLTSSFGQPGGIPLRADFAWAGAISEARCHAEGAAWLLCPPLSVQLREEMSSDFLLKLERALNRSQAPRELIAKDRRAVLRSRIDSEAKMLHVASSKRASPHTLAVIGWLLPRWPGGVRSAAFLNAAEALLSHQSQAVRAEAAVSMGLFRLRRATSVLLGALDDSDNEVRVRVIASLALHGDVRTLPVLVQLLANRDEPAAIRAAAADAMCGFDALGTESPLVAALSDPSVDVRASAAFSLGELRVRSATSLLRKLAGRDRSRVVREAARSALARVNG